MSYDCKISLVQGDCVDSMRVMADESVDLIITDPGYESIEKHRYGGKRNIRKMSTKDGFNKQLKNVVILKANSNLTCVVMKSPNI